MSTEAFKFGKLIATVKQLGSSDLYCVRLTGMSDEFEACLHSGNAASAAVEIIEELAFAASHPHQFFNRRKFSAIESGAPRAEILKMIDVANKAVTYAHRNRKYLNDAISALDAQNARRLG